MRKRSEKRQLEVKKQTIRAIALSPRDLQQVVGGGCPKPSACCTTSPP
jgi:hypothetical protein